jgi:hypothetical protein
MSNAPTVSPTSEAEFDFDSGPMSAASDRVIHSYTELTSHVGSPGLRAAQHRMLREFGVDPEADGVAALGERPAILFAEQPGSWLTPRDLLRARLLERLIDRGRFDPVRSGVRALAHDRFSSDGEKSVFLNFTLHPGLGPARLLGSKTLRRFRHRTYASLHVQAKSYQRMRATWDYSLQMLAAADTSAEQFVEVVANLLDGSPEVGAREILPASNGRAELLAIGRDLRQCRLEPAFKALWPTRARLTKDVLWDVYWNSVNSEFLDLPIGSLSPLLGRLLGAVTDPVRMARRLHRALGAAPEEPVSVAGFVPGGEIFRMVLFDPARERFFLEENDGRLRPVEWDEVRAAAAEGHGGRPSGVLEFLFLAAAGYYLVVDPCDRVQLFQEKACAIHEESTGAKFPWVTLQPRGPFAPDANRFTDMFRPGFVELTVDTLASFLDH